MRFAQSLLAAGGNMLKCFPTSRLRSRAASIDGIIRCGSHKRVTDCLLRGKSARPFQLPGNLSHRSRSAHSARPWIAVSLMPKVLKAIVVRSDALRRICLSGCYGARLGDPRGRSAELNCHKSHIGSS
jgi:hypothetical protein